MLLFFVNSNESAIKILLSKTIETILVLEKIIHAFGFHHVTPISSCWTDFTDMQTAFSSQYFNYGKKIATQLLRAFLKRKHRKSVLYITSKDVPFNKNKRLHFWILISWINFKLMTTCNILITITISSWEL